MTEWVQIVRHDSGVRVVWAELISEYLQSSFEVLPGFLEVTQIFQHRSEVVDISGHV